MDQKIGARIRARRLEIGMSQEALANKLGITFQQVQKYEKGINRVAASKLIQIANALDAPLLSLLPAAKNQIGASVLDDPELLALLPLLLNLNGEGRRVLANLAKSLAAEPGLSSCNTVRSD